MERVGSSARLAGTTKVSTLLATFAALIHRLGGRDDFVLGIPTNARSNPELRSLVAMLATPVAIRIRIEERTTVRELLRQTQRAVFDAMDRPVAIDVLARHEARRTGVLAPVTPVMFNFDPIPDLPPLSDGVRMRIGTPDRRFGLIPFSAEACPTNDGSVNLSFDSSASMYDPEMVECWVDYFVGMLDRLPSTLDEPVSSLPLGGPGA
jgi:nonribosomal peptide synthetase DhbF